MFSGRCGTEVDCGTTEGLLMAPVIEGGDIISSLGDRILGRIVAKTCSSQVAMKLLFPPAP